MEDDVKRVLAHAEDVMRRNFGTAEARASQTRRLSRAVGEAGRRVRNAGIAGGVSAAGVAGYALAIEPIGAMGLLLAVPAVVAVGLGALFVPTRRAVSPAALAKLTPAQALTHAEEWLAERRRQLPGRADRLLDAVCGGLHEVGAQLARRPANDPQALEAQRLAANHLPRLVDTYLAVPPAHRAPGGDVERELADGLKVIAGELKRLSNDLAAAHVEAIKVEGRFLESRYGETAQGPH